MGLLLAIASGLSTAAVTQQVADTAFRPPVENPAYPVGRGPVVLVVRHTDFDGIRAPLHPGSLRCSSSQ